MAVRIQNRKIQCASEHLCYCRIYFTGDGQLRQVLRQCANVLWDTEEPCSSGTISQQIGD